MGNHCLVKFHELTSKGCQDDIPKPIVSNTLGEDWYDKELSDIMTNLIEDSEIGTALYGTIGGVCKDIGTIQDYLHNKWYFRHLTRCDWPVCNDCDCKKWDVDSQLVLDNMISTMASKLAHDNGYPMQYLFSQLWTWTKKNMVDKPNTCAINGEVDCK